MNMVGLKVNGQYSKRLQTNLQVSNDKLIYEYTMTDNKSKDEYEESKGDVHLL